MAHLFRYKTVQETFRLFPLQLTAFGCGMRYTTLVEIKCHFSIARMRWHATVLTETCSTDTLPDPDAVLCRAVAQEDGGLGDTAKMVEIASSAVCGCNGNTVTHEVSSSG